MKYFSLALWQQDNIFFQCLSKSLGVWRLQQTTRLWNFMIYFQGSFIFVCAAGRIWSAAFKSFLVHVMGLTSIWAWFSSDGSAFEKRGPNGIGQGSLAGNERVCGNYPRWQVSEWASERDRVATRGNMGSGEVSQWCGQRLLINGGWGKICLSERPNDNIKISLSD